LDDPALAPQRDIADVLALGGGLPIQVGADTFGGVGSAGSTQEMDEACAKAGITESATSAAARRPLAARFIALFSGEKVTGLCRRNLALAFSIFPTLL